MNPSGILNLLFSLVAFAASISFTVLLGYAFALFFPGTSIMEFGWKFLVAVFSGWLLHFGISSKWLSGKNRNEYYHFLCRLMLLGNLLLVPAIILVLVGGNRSFLVLIISLLLSVGVMFFSHTKEVKKKTYPQKLTFWWLANQIIGAIITGIVLFY